MRKRIITVGSAPAAQPEPAWLDLERLAQVGISSEEDAHPVESALAQQATGGWRASLPGEQTIRLLFDEPQRVRRIQLLFREDELERTQEFVLGSMSDGMEYYSEIVRQQYNFSPPVTTLEVEDYQVNLEGVRALELRIIPDISGGQARASLLQLRLA